MVNAALALDDVPVVGIIGWGEHLGSSRKKVRNHGINWHSTPCNHDAGLTGGPKGRFSALVFELPFDSECGVFLAEGTVGSNREQPLSTALFTGPDRNAFWRDSNINQCNAVLLCST